MPTAPTHIEGMRLAATYTPDLSMRFTDAIKFHDLKV